MMRVSQCIFVLGLQLLAFVSAIPSETIITENIPFDLNGSNFTYQWPVSIYQFASQNGQTLQMAFMDIKPTCAPNGKTAVFIHGKNFCSQTWNATAIAMLEAGYRVILVDQVGFCKSSKPTSYQFTFQGLSRNLLGLLQTVGVNDITLIGHSFGGMTAARFALLYPWIVKKLVLSDALGLENYVGEGIPYPDTDYVLATERQNNYAALRGYEQANYYPGLTWEPAYDVWVNMLVDIYGGSQAAEYTWCQALITDTVLTETVVYELPTLKMPTLVLIGANDPVAIGKAWAPAAVQAVVGKWSTFAPAVAATIPNSTFISIPGQGHAPQISDTLAYNQALLGWLDTN
jgi:pimeloyl-ACP methyl ester carboxylesterase